MKKIFSIMMISLVAVAISFSSCKKADQPADEAVTEEKADVAAPAEEAKEEAEASE